MSSVKDLQGCGSPVNGNLWEPVAKGTYLDPHYLRHVHLQGSVWEDIEPSVSAISHSEGETVISCLTTIMTVENQVLSQVLLGESGHRTTTIIQNPAMDGGLGDGKNNKVIWSVLIFHCQLERSDPCAVPSLQYQCSDGQGGFLIVPICDEYPEDSEHRAVPASHSKLKVFHLYLIL